MTQREIKCGDRVFCVESITELAVAEITEASNDAGVSVYRLTFVFANKVVAGNIGITIPFPMRQILQLYSPFSEYKRNRMVVQWFNPTTVRSNFCCGLPALSAIADGKNNYVTVAVSDAEHDNSVSFCVQDFKEKDEVEFKVCLLCGNEPKNEYSVLLRIDEREIPLADTLRDQTDWFASFYPQPFSYPDICEEPLYSSWYNFHQHPSAVRLSEELKLASEFGFKTVIIDDGWQYDGNGTSDYIDCGDWRFSEEKFSDPKAFTDLVHSFGMQVALWFPVPFVGFHTQAYREFKDKLLYEDRNTLNAGVLDVRYKEVRTHIVDVVKDLMGFGFDGMKLDFIDSFVMKDETPLVNDEMDIPDLTEAVVRLVEELEFCIKAVKSDAMIEFRQNYVGPSIVRFCNMLRVADCAFDSVTNRIAIADMRMLNYRLAVHSDMLLWSKDETDENIAKQLFNVVFGVPQISVRLKELPASQQAVLKNFIGYWTKNRHTLLHGKFIAAGVDCTYSMLASEGLDKDIVALYLKNDYEYKGKRTDILNASRSEYLYIDFGTLSVEVKVYNLYGNLIFADCCSKTMKIEVPIGGRLELG